MIFPSHLLLALAGGALLLPAAPQDRPAEPATTPQQQAEPRPAGTTDAAAGEDKRICRHVKLDMSSRRKTKVCRTAEEWRDLNNPR